jgi:hypothetical protein
VKGINSVSRFIFMTCKCLVVSVPFVENNVFALSNCAPLYACLGLFLSLYSAPLVCLSIILPAPWCLHFCGFLGRLDKMSPALLFASVLFWLLWSVPFHVSFRISLPTPTKSLLGFWLRLY